MAIPNQDDLPAYTYDDYREWEGDWELIAGIPYAMGPAPAKKHQMLMLEIGRELLSSLGDCPVCDVLIDEDWKLDASTVLKPDVSIVCGDENPSYISKTPEVIFEVISPSTVKRDEGLKFRIYQEEGVKYYIMVYPDDLIAKIYELDNGILTIRSICDTESYSFTEIDCPFEFVFSSVFRRFRI